MVGKEWRTKPIPVEEWKERCRKSKVLREGETVIFHPREETISAWIEGKTVFLGAYFLTDTNDGIMAGTGWNH